MFFSFFVSLLSTCVPQAACHSVCVRRMTPCGHSGKGKNNSAANGKGDILDTEDVTNQRLKINNISFERASTCNVTIKHPRTYLMEVKL